MARTVGLTFEGEKKEKPKKETKEKTEKGVQLRDLQKQVIFI